MEKRTRMSAMSGLPALRFLHESGGWTSDDPPECRIHHNVLKRYERLGWVECDRDASGKIYACSVTRAGHEAYQRLAEDGKPDPACHGCSFHYAKLAEVAAVAQ